MEIFGDYPTHCGYIDKEGKITTPFEYELICFLDEAGNEIIPCMYYDVKNFSGGKAQVQKEKDGPWIYINTKGETVDSLPLSLRESYTPCIFH